MKIFRIFSVLLVLLSILLSSCSAATETPTPTKAPPPMGAILSQDIENSFQWLQANALMADKVDWADLRKEAAILKPELAVSTDMYPILCKALRQLRDANAWLFVPDLETPGFASDYLTLTPEYTLVAWVMPDSDAEKAGLQTGDVIKGVNGKPVQPYNPDNLWVPCNTVPLDDSPQEVLDILREGQPMTITIERKTYQYSDPLYLPTGRNLEAGSGTAGYFELPTASGYYESFPGEVQKLMKELDSNPVCGWIIDLRRTFSGDFWYYMGAVGSLLETELPGGFAYRDGTHDIWAYRDQEVFWGEISMPEGLLVGEGYVPKHVPVALLISPGTQAASELLVVAFSGRTDLRTFGEPTFGLPTLVTQKPLLDGSRLFVSGAYSYDRNQTTFDGPIVPDVTVQTNWGQFGSDQDMVVRSAVDWLSTQSTCQQ